LSFSFGRNKKGRIPMKKILLFSLCLLLLLPVLPAAAEDEGISFVDMKGREIHLDKPATRIVALTAADCEIICAIGAGDLLVGRGEYCNYPESVLDLPVVNSGAETNLEQIIALEPDVVVMNTMNQTVEQVQTLENSGIVVVVSVAEDIDGVKYAINMLGILCGKEAEASELVLDMEAIFAEISKKSSDSGKTVYFEISPLEYGLWTAGKGTFMDEIASICGLTNIFSDVDGWAEVSQEQVLMRNPDVIVTVTADYGAAVTPAQEIMNRPGWENISAIQNQLVFGADNDQMTRPGPRLMDAAKSLFLFLNPEEALDPAA